MLLMIRWCKGGWAGILRYDYLDVFHNTLLTFSPSSACHVTASLNCIDMEVPADWVNTAVPCLFPTRRTHLDRTSRRHPSSTSE